MSKNKKWEKSLLCEREHAVINNLVASWNEWMKLEPLYEEEAEEFRRAIHAAQSIVMARPVQREMNSDFKKADED